MGHGAWGMGHVACSMGHGAWGMEHGAGPVRSTVGALTARAMVVEVQYPEASAKCLPSRVGLGSELIQGCTTRALRSALRMHWCSC